MGLVLQWKSRGGLRLRDMKNYGISLANKWIIKTSKGKEPWKVLIRNNIQNAFPKQARNWKFVPMYVVLFGSFPGTLAGSNVFKSIWKAWENIRKNGRNGEFLTLF